jgi:type II secretory pathway component GspD/PulD (secretin)
MKKIWLFAFYIAVFSGLASAAQPAVQALPERLSAETGSIGGFPEEYISLDLRDMDLPEAFKYIASKTGLNIVPTKGVAGKISLTVSDVSIKDIFDIILRSNNLAFIKQGNIYNVMTEQEYKQYYGRNFFDNRVFKVFHLQFAVPEQVSSLLGTMKSDIGKVLIDQESGVVLMIDTADRVANMGRTLEAMDKKTVIEVFTLKYARAKDIEEQLKQQLDNKKVGTIKADERTNQVVVQTLPERMEGIRKLIGGLDQKTKEILVDARIVQVKMSDQIDSSISWEGLFNPGNINGGMEYIGSYPFSAVQSSTASWRSRSTVLSDMGGNVGSYPFSGTSNDYAAGSPVAPGQEMHVGIVGGRRDFDVVLKYLQTLGKTRILSNPKLAVINNQEAKIHVGERQAYITTTTTQTQTSTTVSEAVTYVDVGIQLSVTPTINEDGFITIKIKPEISSVLSYLDTSSNNKVPIIDTSTAETVVMVKDGTSILIGGLSKVEKTDGSKGIPFLSKIPVIGKAFKQDTQKNIRSEMIVLLTPHIINGDELISGSARDLSSGQKEYKPYSGLTQGPNHFTVKPYQDYPVSVKEQEFVPQLKPAKDF